MSDIEEQAISKAAEVGLSSQLDEAEDLEVDVHTDAGKLVQGELESVEIEGNGLVMEKDLRTEELDIEIDNISIDPIQAAFGNIKLEHPTDATAHVILTQEDIERAFNSSYIQNKLRNLEVKVNNKSTRINTQHVSFQIPDSEKIALSAKVNLVETGENREVSFTAIPKMKAGGHRISLEEVDYREGKEVSPELTSALLDGASELLDLRNFELEGMSLRLQKLDLEKGQLTLQAKTRVENFPDA